MSRLLQRIRRRAGDERGAALILVAVGLPAFVAFGIFVIDVGNWWVHKRHLQTQADAAALAGAREYRFPVCNDQAIVEEAVDYSGGVLADPDVNYAAFDATPLAYNHQLAASARPSGPTQGLHTQVNTPDPWDGASPTDRDADGVWVDDDPASNNDGDLKDMTAAERKPCSAMFLDVKMTETDIAGRFSPLRFLDVLGFVDFIDARARVELRKQAAATGMLPLAVEDLNPTRAHVWLYDEDTQQLLGDAELEPRDAEDGLLIFDNSAAGGGTPMAINMSRETIAGVDVTKQHIGAVIAFSANDSITCGDPGVECYGSSSDGVTRIRGSRAFEGPEDDPLNPITCTDGIDNDGDGTTDGGLAGDSDCRGIRLGDAYLQEDIAGCADNDYETHDNGYFSTECDAATLAVQLPGLPGANESADNIQVDALIQDGNGTSTVALHYVAAEKVWKTTGTDRLPIEMGVGTRRIDINWSQRRQNSTLDMGGTTPATCLSNQNNNPCKGTFTNVHKVFSGSRPVSGPVKEVRVDVGGITDVNNLQRCTASQTCTESVVVRIGLAGRLEITPPDSPPVALRISASGPEVLQTQQLNCEPGNENTIDELAYGCSPLYGIKDDQDPCPSKATLHGSPNPPPWECVAVKPGTMNGPVGARPQRAHPVRAAESRGQLRRPFRKAATSAPARTLSQLPGRGPADPGALPGAVRLAGRDRVGRWRDGADRELRLLLRDGLAQQGRRVRQPVRGRWVHPARSLRPRHRPERLGRGLGLLHLLRRAEHRRCR